MVGETRDGALVEGSGTTDRELDVIFNLLSHRRRRYALASLAEETGTVSVADLAEDVARRENDSRSAGRPDEKRREITVSLAHAHLPQLAAAGAIEYDRDTGLVRESETAARIQQIRSFAGNGESER